MNNKRYKRNYRFYILMVIITILSIFLTYKGFYFLTTSKTERDLKKLSYNKEAISLIIDYKLDKYLINNKIYSKTLETALTEGQYEKDLLEEYVYFSYMEYDNYIEQLNNLALIGYSRSQIESVFEYLNQDEIDVIIEKEEPIDNITEYISNEYFWINNLNRYTSYKKKFDNYNYDKVISYVNMNLDYPYYEHTIEANNQDSLLVIANKYYKLSSTFEPKNLVKINNDFTDEWDRWVIPIVKDKFEKMATYMKGIGLNIRATSAYRSYQVQEDLYNNYVRSNGKTAADTFSARAGYSEHQTGLAIDVKAGGGYSKFETTNEYTWMKDNAHKYGFILRYPKDKTDITGYKFEAWHFRYVGEEVAKYIYDNDLVFDEYYAMFIANKKD